MYGAGAGGTHQTVPPARDIPCEDVWVILVRFVHSRPFVAEHCPVHSFSFGGGGFRLR